jgi:hypothetical protein
MTETSPRTSLTGLKPDSIFTEVQNVSHPASFPSASTSCGWAGEFSIAGNEAQLVPARILVIPLFYQQNGRRPPNQMGGIDVFAKNHRSDRTPYGEVQIS